MRCGVQDPLALRHLNAFGDALRSASAGACQDAAKAQEHVDDDGQVVAWPMRIFSWAFFIFPPYASMVLAAAADAQLVSPVLGAEGTPAKQHVKRLDHL